MRRSSEFCKFKQTRTDVWRWYNREAEGKSRECLAWNDLCAGFRNLCQFWPLTPGAAMFHLGNCVHHIDHQFNVFFISLLWHICRCLIVLEQINGRKVETKTKTPEPSKQTRCDSVQEKLPSERHPEQIQTEEAPESTWHFTSLTLLCLPDAYWEL